MSTYTGQGWVEFRCDDPNTWPPRNRSVIAFCTERCNQYTAYMDWHKSLEWFHFAPGNDKLDEKVTHWMLLPSSPTN